MNIKAKNVGAVRERERERERELYFSKIKCSVFNLGIINIDSNKPIKI